MSPPLDLSMRHPLRLARIPATHCISLTPHSLACANLLPPSYAGHVTAVAVGSPPVLLDEGAAAGAAATDTEPAEAEDATPTGSPPPRPPSPAAAAPSPPPSTSRAGAAVPVPRYLLVVNDCDVVPRTLGSPLPVGTMAMLLASHQGGGKVSPAVMKRERLPNAHASWLRACVPTWRLIVPAGGLLIAS